MRTPLLLAAVTTSLLMTAPAALADDVPPPGAVESGPPVTATEPDGWTLTVSAANESEDRTHALTDSLTSREYVVGGDFSGAITGTGDNPVTSGSLEVGYQIGCNHMFGGFTPGGSALGGMNAMSPTLGVGGSMSVDIHPGQNLTVPVDKKMFQGGGEEVHVTLNSIHIKVDGCIGGAFLRSYATFLGSTSTSDDVITYMGTRNEF